ncbi:hypothetical protein GN956_G5610 [Arapaima gigas]
MCILDRRRQAELLGCFDSVRRCVDVSTAGGGIQTYCTPEFSLNSAETSPGCCWLTMWPERSGALVPCHEANCAAAVTCSRSTGKSREWGRGSIEMFSSSPADWDQPHAAPFCSGWNESLNRHSSDHTQQTPQAALSTTSQRGRRRQLKVFARSFLANIPRSRGPVSCLLMRSHPPLRRSRKLKQAAWRTAVDESCSCSGETCSAGCYPECPTKVCRMTARKGGTRQITCRSAVLGTQEGWLQYPDPMASASPPFYWSGHLRAESIDCSAQPEHNSSPSREHCKVVQVVGIELIAPKDSSFPG